MRLSGTRTDASRGILPPPPLDLPRSPHRRHRLDILNLNNIFMNEWTRHKSPREYCGTGIRLELCARPHARGPPPGPGGRGGRRDTPPFINASGLNPSRIERVTEWQTMETIIEWMEFVKRNWGNTSDPVVNQPTSSKDRSPRLS